MVNLPLSVYNDGIGVAYVNPRYVVEVYECPGPNDSETRLVPCNRGGLTHVVTTSGREWCVKISCSETAFLLKGE